MLYRKVWNKWKLTLPTDFTNPCSISMDRCPGHKLDEKHVKLSLKHQTLESSTSYFVPFHFFGELMTPINMKLELSPHPCAVFCDEPSCKTTAMWPFNPHTPVTLGGECCSWSSRASQWWLVITKQAVFTNKMIKNSSLEFEKCWGGLELLILWHGRGFGIIQLGRSFLFPYACAWEVYGLSILPDCHRESRVLGNLTVHICTVALILLLVESGPVLHILLSNVSVYYWIYILQKLSQTGHPDGLKAVWFHICSFTRNWHQ